MEFRHESGIYICTCSGNGKQYIGQSKDVKLRKCQHLSELRYGKHYNDYMQKSYNKYGENSLEWDVLEYCSPDMLDEREQYWIKAYGTFSNGFNGTAGGSFNRVYIRTDEFKEALSAKMKQTWEYDIERRKKFSQNMTGENNPMYGKRGNLNPAYGANHSGAFNGMFGKHQTEEAKEKNRIAHMGKNNKTSKPVVCVETGEIFASMGEAGRCKNCNDTTINKCCKGVKKTAGGFHWRYATDEEIQAITHTA